MIRGASRICKRRLEMRRNACADILPVYSMSPKTPGGHLLFKNTSGLPAFCYENLRIQKGCNTAEGEASLIPHEADIGVCQHRLSID
jgi:hypothetical protein